MLSDPAPRPPTCYDPATPPHRDSHGVHVYDHATIRALLRDPQRVTSDVTRDDHCRAARPPAPREHLRLGHRPPDAERMPGPARRAALRDGAVVHAPRPPRPGPRPQPRSPPSALDVHVEAHTAGGSFDVYLDYALPWRWPTWPTGWASSPRTSTYAIDDQLAAGDMFASWPPLATPEMDEYYRELMSRPGLTGVAAEARELVRAGTLDRAGVVGRSSTRSRSARWRPRRRRR